MIAAHLLVGLAVSRFDDLELAFFVDHTERLTLIV